MVISLGRRVFFFDRNFDLANHGMWARIRVPNSAIRVVRFGRIGFMTLSK
jgi:hypothetical protein